MDSERYNGLDILRVICSFGVVFLHVYVSSGLPSSLEFVVSLRDFALPAMVMTSFFLLTISLLRKPKSNFKSFARSKVKRLWLPFIVWTSIYTLTFSLVIPAFFNFEGFGNIPSASVFISGYRHLWFLQFVFAASLMCFLIIRRVSALSPNERDAFGAFFLVIAGLYGGLYYWALKDLTDWHSLWPEADLNLRIFVSQIAAHFIYVPLGVALGLVSGRVKDCFKSYCWRNATLGFAVASMLLHSITGGSVPFTREVFAVSVFLLALLPWKRPSYRLTDVLATYSYGIYILHFLPAQVLWLVIAHNELQPGGDTALTMAVAIYFGSLAVSYLIRKVFAVEWLMPLVSTKPIDENRKATSHGIPLESSLALRTRRHPVETV